MRKIGVALMAAGALCAAACSSNSASNSLVSNALATQLANSLPAGAVSNSSGQSILASATAAGANTSAQQAQLIQALFGTPQQRAIAAAQQQQQQNLGVFHTQAVFNTQPVFTKTQQVNAHPWHWHWHFPNLFGTQPASPSTTSTPLNTATGTNGSIGAPVTSGSNSILPWTGGFKAQ